ncbi:class I SAM-dependent methyltransferase [Candidatus Kaiserbacteria bacterium]|nr:class I SAM-dependent methyltransferase [Candidatus Kaiserbacteria bacterium]
MSLRKKIYAVFPLARKVTALRNHAWYHLAGRKPWARGYFEHKWATIGRAIRNEALLDLFRQKGRLPAGFGRGIDDRAIEYPWLLSRLPIGPSRLLDAGSVLNFETILDHPKLADKQITIANLNPEPNCFWRRGVSYVFEDIRQLPFKSDMFDMVTCISTLEHIGMDNTEKYTADSRYKENRPDDYLRALEELRRILVPGGTLYLSVPFGERKHFGFLQQFDSSMLRAMVALFSESESVFYHCAEDGWQISTEEEGASATFTPPEHARKDTSLPAGAGALACLKLIK